MVSNWKQTQNVQVYSPFSSYYININRTESNAQDSFNICFNFSSFFQIFALLYSRVGAGAGAGAGAASKFLPGAA
jgi:hypothetical protein